MLSTVIGVSDHPDMDKATAEVIASCKEQLNGKQVQAGIIFTSRMDGDMAAFIDTISSAFSGVKIIGCTTDGEIVPGRGRVEESVSLMLLGSETLHFATAIAEEISVTDGMSIVSAFRECEKQMTVDPVMGVLLPDGLSTIGVSLDVAIKEATGGRVPLFGGTAGDYFNFTGTYQFYGGKVYQDAAPILLIGGEVEVVSQVKIGVEPMGRKYSIADVEKNVIGKIDNKPAAQVYEALLGEYAYEQQASQFPLAVYEDDSGDFYLRDPFKVDKESGKVTFIGNIAENAMVRFVSIDQDQIIIGADEVNDYLLGDCNQVPDLILIFSCTSRKHVLGTNTNRELRKLLDLHPQIPFFGFYCYGELGPVKPGGSTKFHNDTYVALGLKVK